MLKHSLDLALTEMYAKSWTSKAECVTNQNPCMVKISDCAFNLNYTNEFYF